MAHLYSGWRCKHLAWLLGKVRAFLGVQHAGELPRRKLQQLEAAAGQANLKRARYMRGLNCIWCTCVCHRRLLPDYLRTWDMSIT